MALRQGRADSGAVARRGYMDSDGYSQLSASTKWLALAEPTYNWELSMSVHGDILKCTLISLLLISTGILIR